LVPVTTARHEGALALAALWQGVPVRSVRLFPGLDPEPGFYFGYVSRGDGGTWMIDAVPFAAVLIWFAVVFPVLRTLSRRPLARMPLFFNRALPE
jgi:hypothetical protein